MYLYMYVQCSVVVELDSLIAAKGNELACHGDVYGRDVQQILHGGRFDGHQPFKLHGQIHVGRLVNNFRARISQCIQYV